MYFKAKKNAAEYDQQKARYFLNVALALQTSLFRQFGRDDLAVEIDYSGMYESKFPVGDEIPDSTRPVIFITSTVETSWSDTVNVFFPSIIGDLCSKDEGDEFWTVLAFDEEEELLRKVELDNDTISDRMLLKLAATVNSLI